MSNDVRWTLLFLSIAFIGVHNIVSVLDHSNRHAETIEVCSKDTDNESPEL